MLAIVFLLILVTVVALLDYLLVSRLHDGIDSGLRGR